MTRAVTLRTLRREAERSGTEFIRYRTTSGHWLLNVWVSPSDVNFSDTPTSRRFVYGGLRALPTKRKGRR